jgi:REP-associated tyrosine transposase
MPRRPRIELAGAVHHVVAKSPSGRDLFHDDDDRDRYLRLVMREVLERTWSVLTFCLMTNHIHLLVLTPNPDLGAGIKRMHEDYARSLNGRYKLHGHAFGSRFYSRLVQSDRHLIGCLRYIARNPVKHGACRQPRDWAWSAHRALAGLAPAPSFLDVATAYSHLGADAEEARLNYLRLVALSDDALLNDLTSAGSDAWLITAVDDFEISIAAVAAFLGVGRTTVYERLAAVRRTEGSVPSVRTRI